MADNTPRILAGRYELGDLIGRGGMAEVRVGRDARLGRTVAIKILRPDLARDPAFQARFRREAQAAASLNHPAIVAVYDTGEDVSTNASGETVRVPFIVMEYVEGHTVRELVRDGAALPIDEAIDITIGVLSALQYSHHAGIVHRDIKPANIMLTATGQVKVMDFGIARALADTAQTMTQTQAVIGTAQYLSPEQARGETVDARSDLYSTGCVLYELLTGRPPFIGDSAVAIAYQHVREEPVAPSIYAPDIPRELDRITLKTLQKDRDLRYTTASEFRADLEAVRHGGAVPTASGPGIALEPTPPPPAIPLPADPTQVITPPTLATRAMARAAAGGVPGAAAPPPHSFASAGVIIPPEEDEDEEDDGERRKRIIIIAIISAVAVIGLGLLLWGILRGSSQPDPGPSETTLETSAPTETTPAEVEVPDIAPGTTEALVKRQLEQANLVPVLGKGEKNDEVAEGTLIRLEPAPGEMVAEGSEVTYILSAGADQFELIDVSGMTQAAARTALQTLNLVGGNAIDQDSPTVREGQVIETDPKAGTMVKKGDTITIILSTGLTEVPDVVRHSQADAEQMLRDAGLAVGNIRQDISDQTPGTVIEQLTPAGDHVRQGVQVSLVVARAPKEFAMPNVETMTESSARATIEGAEYALRVTEVRREHNPTVPNGYAVRTEPAAGASVREGDTVILILSDGPEPTTAPPPTTPSTDPAAGG